MRNTSKTANAPEMLLALRSELGGWRAVEKRLKINRGYLSAIAHGKRKPSNRVLAALGLPLEHVSVAPCPKCGQLHAFAKRCPGAATKYAPHPVMRLSHVRRILQSRYLKDS